MNKGNQKHTTFEQRVEIEKGLTENKSFAEIARIIGKDPSTVSKEVRLHAQVKERPDPGYTNPPCIHRKECKMILSSITFPASLRFANICLDCLYYKNSCSILQPLDIVS